MSSPQCRGKKVAALLCIRANVKWTSLIGVPGLQVEGVNNLVLNIAAQCGNIGLITVGWGRADQT
jgi:hypothetical protein